MIILKLCVGETNVFNEIGLTITCLLFYDESK